MNISGLFLYYICKSNKLIMNTNQILEIIRNSKFTKDKNNKFGPSQSSKILCVFNKKLAYGIWIVKYNNEDYDHICVCKMVPVICSGLTLKDLPKSIDKMTVMWADEVKEKFETIKNAMLNYK